jgi:ketosteroid isomerase-like protein
MVTSTKNIVEKVNAAFADNKMEDFLAFCADDFEWTMVGDETKKGKDSIRQWMGSIPSDVPKFDVKQVIAEGDFVVCYGDMTMKEQKVDVPYSYCDLYRFRDGKIAELRSWVMKTGGK